MAETMLVKPDRHFIKRVEKAGGGNLHNCYQCATCAAVCKLSPEDKPFPRKEMIYAQWGLKDKLAADPDVWLCHQCNDCSVRCPRGARPGDVMAALRNYSFEHFAFPSFMGKLLASPFGLPILFLIPILILGTLAHWSEMATFQGHVHFYNFIHNGTLEILFMGGNALVFLLAAVGLARFYRGMSATWRVKPQKG
ncbi:MAG: 4Fe-4S dicluster domain-containing protein, partial [Calditrichota bacterium]